MSRMPRPPVSLLGLGVVRLSRLWHTADGFWTLHMDDPFIDVRHDGDPVLLLASLYACHWRALAHHDRDDFGENRKENVSAPAA